MCRALVIEDDPQVRLGLRMLMETWGFATTEAESTPSALLAAHEAVPDVIVADYRLAGDDTGVAAVKAVRMLLREDVPAAIVTGDTDPRRLLEIASHGLQVLNKPVRGDELRSLVRLLVRGECCQRLGAA